MKLGQFVCRLALNATCVAVAGLKVKRVIITITLEYKVCLMLKFKFTHVRDEFLIT